MIRSEGDDFVEIRQPVFLRLTREGEHQVKVHAGESRRPRPLVGLQGLFAGVQTTQRIQQRGP